MNQFSQYTFRIYHYLLTARDTLEYTIKKEHDVKIYNTRKKTLIDNLQEKTPFGDFLKNNGEAGEKIKETANNFVEELYGDSSSVLMVSGDKVRVDSAQFIKIYEMVSGFGETLRDIVYQYITFGRQNSESDKQIDPEIVELIVADERMYRTVLSMLVMHTFQESFAEFQKVMGESQGKPTPQSNFIVQNELLKMSGILRASRQHAHCTDNETLDILDDVLKVIEMTEGRRDRPNNKGFKEIFDEINKKLNEYVAKTENVWKQVYSRILGELTNQPKKEENN